MTSKRVKSGYISVLEEAARNATRIAFKEVLANGKTWLNAVQIKNLTLGTIIKIMSVFSFSILQERNLLTV
ncbi:MULTISPECIES: hypothetical protein [Escherichia]|nr:MULTISPECIES: hypothetical protein [Escherichia]MCU8646407.1 hypothetical protein [Escherichia coli]AXM04281.1 hypothetical protein DKG79_20605 [Escherichia fergusonii]EFL4497451.1 hypothetical protein [Escherichia fergusonii]EHG5984399.1 hypothetical protein [Escherichia fergusonii]EHG6004099.1 hypothetical protein [Escherichia fergusonii]